MELYENGVRKTTGFSFPSPGIINVVWNSVSGTGQIKARGYAPKINVGSVTGCYLRQSWKSITVSFLSGEPYGIIGPALCTNNVAQNFTIQSGCDGKKYDWEAPVNWVIDGGSNIINGK